MENFHKACQLIIDHSDKKAVNWAVNYAKHGLTTTNEHDANWAALYILNNIQYWRGEVAKDVRMLLKKFTGIK